MSRRRRGSPVSPSSGQVLTLEIECLVDVHTGACQLHARRLLGDSFNGKYPQFSVLIANLAGFDIGG